MKILKHIGSNFPERDGGGIIAQKPDGSVWLFYICEGGNPGDVFEVETFDLGKTERGYKAFTVRLAEALGYDRDPVIAIDEISDDVGIGTTAEIRNLASSIDGRADLLVRVGENGWWFDIDPEPQEVPYEQIEKSWIAPSKGQCRFSGSDFADIR